MTENVASLRSVKVATPPCDTCASIPCGLAVRKQHEMLFAASKFGKTNTENQTVDWSQCAKSDQPLLAIKKIPLKQFGYLPCLL